MVFPTLKDKVIIVTGATRGLGALVAGIAKENGARVSGVYRKDLAPESPKDITWYQGDVADEERAEQIVAEVGKLEGRVDMLLPMAAVCYLTSPKDPTYAAKRRESKAVNQDGVEHYVRAFERTLEKYGGDGIIVLPGTIAVTLALMPHTGGEHDNFGLSIEPYTATKGAMSTFGGSVAHSNLNLALGEIRLGCNETGMLWSESPQIAKQFNDAGMKPDGADLWTPEMIYEGVLPTFNARKKNIPAREGAEACLQLAVALQKNRRYRIVEQPGAGAPDNYVIA